MHGTGCEVREDSALLSYGPGCTQHRTDLSAGPQTQPKAVCWSGLEPSAQPKAVRWSGLEPSAQPKAVRWSGLVLVPGYSIQPPTHLSVRGCCFLRGGAGGC